MCLGSVLEGMSGAAKSGLRFSGLAFTPAPRPWVQPFVTSHLSNPESTLDVQSLRAIVMTAETRFLKQCWEKALLSSEVSSLLSSRDLYRSQETADRPLRHGCSGPFVASTR